MSVALIERTRTGAAQAAGSRLFEPWRGGPTLEDLISSAWEGLATHGTAPCPVCDGELQPRETASPGMLAGRCGSCHSTLD